MIYYKCILFLIISILFYVDIVQAEPYMKDDNGKYIKQWVYYRTDNKYVELNRFSIEYVTPWIVRYDIKRDNGDIVIVNRLEMNLKTAQAKILDESWYKNERDIYETDKRIKYNDYSQEYEYRDIKDETVNMEIYKMFMQNYAPDHHW